MGVVAALLKFFGTKVSLGPLSYSFHNGEGVGGERLAIVAYLVLVAYMAWDSWRGRPD
jgi:hypothetical protein